MNATADPTEMLREGLRQLAVPDAESTGVRLSQFLDELERWNPRFGFVKAASRGELIVKHVLDSLSAWKQLRDEALEGRVLDVGSGAGFPGIPLAIALAGISFTLLERSAKKVSFLRTCKALLGLARVEVVQGDLSSLHAPFDVVTFRAVAPLARFLEEAGPGGITFHSVVAYKGRIERARQEVVDVQRSTRDRFSVEVVPLTVPFLEEERCVVILRS